MVGLAEVEAALASGPGAGNDDRYDVVLASAGMAHDGGTLAERSLGGSETAAILVAKALAARGHHVTVFSPCEGGTWDGVTYLPIAQFHAYATAMPHDVTIVSRAPAAMRPRFASKLSVLWCHDLATKPQRAELGGTAWNMDAIYLPSRYMLGQFREVHGGIPEAAYHVTRNGVDLAAFGGLEGLGRRRNVLVYGSRPERGLEAALNLMEDLAARGSDAILHVSTYDNFAEEMRPFYEAWWGRAARMPNVKLLGPLKQSEWHRELATARALVYPGPTGPFAPFREIYGIVLAEAQAAGTPVVACAKGAVPETLAPQAGYLVGDEGSDVASTEYRRAFADAVMEVLGQDALWRSMSFAGRERATMLGWEGVAEDWEAHWRECFAARTADAWRMRRHLERTGDREALEIA